MFPPPQTRALLPQLTKHAQAPHKIWGQHCQPGVPQPLAMQLSQSIAEDRHCSTVHHPPPPQGHPIGQDWSDLSRWVLP